NDAVRLTRAGGRLVVIGMQGEERVDWAPIWQRELQVTGAYAYGVEKVKPPRRTFELALEVAPELELERLSGPVFPPSEYREAPDVRQLVLEEVVEMVADAGVEDLHIIAANSLHRRMTADEIRHIVGDRIFTTFWPDRLYNHDGEDPDGNVYIGSTGEGEEVTLNRRAAESDLVIYVNLTLVPMDGGHKSLATGL